MVAIGSDKRGGTTGIARDFFTQLILFDKNIHCGVPISISDNGADFLKKQERLHISSLRQVATTVFAMGSFAMAVFTVLGDCLALFQIVKELPDIAYDEKFLLR